MFRFISNCLPINLLRLVLLRLPKSTHNEKMLNPNQPFEVPILIGKSLSFKLSHPRMKPFRKWVLFMGMDGWGAFYSLSFTQLLFLVLSFCPSVSFSLFSYFCLTLLVLHSLLALSFFFLSVQFSMNFISFSPQLSMSLCAFLSFLCL